MNISPLVQLFRASDDRAFEEGLISGVTEYESGLRLIRLAEENGSGRVEGARADGVEIDAGYLEDAPAEGCSLFYRFRIHTQSLSTFHASLDKLLFAGSEISRGIFPSEFYIVDIDAYSGDTEPCWIIHSLATACRAIALLAKIAHYHDSKSDTGYLQLVFIDAASEKLIKPILVNTIVSSEIVRICRSIDLSLLEQLAGAAPESDPHFASRQGVFYATVSEFLGGSSGKEDNFEKLLSEWKIFSNTFQANLNTYVSGFAFHKAKKEVAEAEFDIAGQYAKVLGDITGKLLAIPISFAALVALSKAGELSESIFLVLGLMFASLLISGVIHNQRRHFKLIKQAKAIVIDSINGKIDSYPKELRCSIETMKSTLSTDECRLRWTLNILQVLAWSPSIIGVAYLYIAQ